MGAAARRARTRRSASSACRDRPAATSSCSFPTGATARASPDGAILEPDDTTSNVDLDELFATFDPKTRTSLRGVFRGSSRQYAGQGENATQGWLYLDPALVSASRLFGELNRDTRELRRFINETSGLVGDIAERRDDLAGLVDNLADTTGAIARPEGALAEAIHQLPPFLRQANTTYVNLRATLDDLDPLVKTSSRWRRSCCRTRRAASARHRPAARPCRPGRRYPAAGQLERPGRARATPPLRDIAVGPVRRNGAEREGALPAAAEALASATPRIAFARPYSVDFTGWLDDFSHTGNFDAMGGFARIGTHVNAFSVKDGLLSPLAPAPARRCSRTSPRSASTTAAPARSSATRGDGSTPWRPSPDFNCDPTQLPVGP